MAYLYKAIVYKTPQVLGLTDNSHAADITDFETNHKSSATLVTTVTIAETTFEIDKTYTAFKVLITGDLTWADVEYTEDNAKYTFNLLSDTAL